MFSASKLQFRKRGPGIVPITAVNGPFNEGEVAGTSTLVRQLVITGGTGPFTVRLYNQVGTIVQTTTGFTSGNNITYTLTTADDVGLYLDITDSLGQTYTSGYWITFTSVYVVSVNLTANTYTPSAGSTVTLTANPAASVAGTRTYTWYYRQKPNGGSYSTGFSTFGGSSVTQLTGACASGITYQFYVNLSNLGGVVSSNSIECVTP